MTSRGFSFATRQQQLVTLTLHTYAPPVTLPLLHSHPTHKRNVRRSLFSFARRAPRAAASNHLLLIIVFVV